MGVHYLSDEYMEAGNAALAASVDVQPAIKGVEVTMAFKVTDGPDGDLEHYIRIGDDKVTIGRGSVENPDATIRNSYKTSAKLSKGELSNQMGFLTGKIKISGNMGVLMKHNAALDLIQATLSDLNVDY